ncbi:hypothetical protein DFP72DRAFT_874242 [Ephemerocybe angulata]|uniref:Hyaluronan-mediated motility receptor C-terminal domain-containing protein n=1 Tax=Ephemerocybe angulata TaxID=980116 RepID=A0A8H6ICH7_9AGAR|nr:hypothetical protein DFP72DRAFT_874242 [Tulosesus angulatus]
MFAKGSRFNKSPVSETPGPTDYNPQEPNFDTYKRGAFLEKSERFREPEPSPTTECDMNRTKTTAAPTHKSGSSVASVDRYAILQRKVEDLEHVHQEGKRALIEKQKKQNQLLEARVQDLKRTKGSEETELKEVRLKLRSLENERSRLQANSSEVQDLKSSLQSLEIKRKEEIRERDSRILELERTLAVEKKAREALAVQHHQLKKATDTDSKAATKKLQALVDQKAEECAKLKHDLARVQESTASREDDLVLRLEQHTNLLSHVASEFGRLATQSVRRSLYEDLETKHHTIHIQKLKLERKLANSEAQVIELVHLIRQSQTDSLILSQQLEDACQEITFVRENLVETDVDPSPELHALLAIQHSIYDHQLTASKIEERTSQLLADFYRLHSTDLTITSYIQRKELTVTEIIAEQHATQVSEVLASHEAIASRLESVSNDYAKTQEQIACTTADKQVAERDLRNLDLKLEEKDALLAGIDSKHKQALKKERDTIQRLTSTIQKDRMAEDALREEIDKMSSELQDLEWYQQAYENLNKQIALLVSRNQIAEEEANHLSECNAEILGHHNPAQRIMYVDRIRRELAEAKQQIAELNLEKERAEAQGSHLQQELEMYTSVMVPVGSKPRTNLTRVTRVPLSNVSESLNKSLAPPLQGSSLHRKTESYTSPSADLTIDDLS